MSIFSYVSGYACLIWENICWSSSPIFWMGSLNIFVVEFWECFIDVGSYSIFWCIMFKYFLSFDRVSLFNYSFSFFSCLNYKKTHPIVQKLTNFVAFAFAVISENKHFLSDIPGEFCQCFNIFSEFWSNLDIFKMLFDSVFMGSIMEISKEQ